MNVIFWHICGLDNYYKIIIEQYSSIISSGLINDIDKIYITYVGKNINELDKFLSLHPKLSLHVYNDDVLQFERPCLHSLYDWSKYNNANILYIHSKGIRWLCDGGRVANIFAWRRMMEYFLIHNYKSCLAKLDRYDCVGCNFINPPDRIKKETHAAHFSGNFWWTKTSWIRKLPSRIAPNIKQLDVSETRTYLLPERWLLIPFPKVKIYEIYHDNERCHYYDHSPSLSYKETNLDENKFNKTIIRT